MTEEHSITSCQMLASFRKLRLFFSFYKFTHLNVLTQTSTPGALYSLPSKSSGAAYGGLPHQVFREDPGENVLLNPKSKKAIKQWWIRFCLSTTGTKWKYINGDTLYWTRMWPNCRLQGSEWEFDQYMKILNLRCGFCTILNQANST